MGYKSPKKTKTAQSPKGPKARKPQSYEARVLTSKPEPKAKEYSSACPNTKVDTYHHEGFQDLSIYA